MYAAAVIIWSSELRSKYLTQAIRTRLLHMFWRAIGEIVRRVCRYVILFNVSRVCVLVLQTPDEELSTKCDVDAHITVHGVLAQQVDTKFLSSLCEAEETVESDYVSEDPTTFVVVYEV